MQPKETDLIEPVEALGPYLDTTTVPEAAKRTGALHQEVALTEVVLPAEQTPAGERIEIEALHQKALVTEVPAVVQKTEVQIAVTGVPVAVPEVQVAALEVQAGLPDLLQEADLQAAVEVVEEEIKVQYIRNIKNLIR